MAAELTEVTERATVLRESELDDIVEGALAILAETGFVYGYGPALDAVEAAGCPVDDATGRARLPRDVVEEALRLAPSGFVLPGRTPERDLHIDTSHAAFTVSGGGTIWDRHAGGQRRLVKDDLRELVTFIDRVDQLDLINSPLAIADCRRELAGEVILAEVLKYGHKPIEGCGPIGVEIDKRVQLELADAAGRTVMNAIGPVSPLSLPDNMCEALMLWAERRWPSLCWSGPTPGANGPATLAGTLVIALAEMMAQIVLAQSVGPGTPIIAGYSAMLMDMRSGNVYTGIEGPLLCNAGVQLLHRFGIPFWSACPMVTGNVAGWQNAMQVGMHVPLLALGGGNIVSVSGGLSMACTYAYHQLLLDAELIATAKRYVRGIVVDDETLACEVIGATGPAPGDYLGAQHTREHYRREIYLPALFTTAPYEVWERAGAKDAVARAEDEAARLWETAVEPDPLPDDVCRELDRIIERAEQRLGASSRL